MLNCEKVLIILIYCVYLIFLGFANGYRCGVDNSDKKDITEGAADIETYPWLGLLFYPVGVQDDLIMTTIILVTRQIALAAALDIDNYPKKRFRTLARVVLGHNCSGPYIKVKDYTYHPDFSRVTYSTLAIVQLDTLLLVQDIRPICPPPIRIKEPQIYAMTLSQDCTSAMVDIYKMEYVDESKCREFYRKSNLDIESLWPTHYACARATSGGNCVWKGGTVLAMKENDQWRLLGIGVYGPGCEAPARFLDYGIYHTWVRSSLARIGKPAITRMGPDHIILRRTMENVQRFGKCDPEEMKYQLFTDYTLIKYETNTTVTYNLTLISNVDYSCLSLRVYNEKATASKPIIRLRRWCTNPHPICYDFGYLQIDFSVDIKCNMSDLIYEVNAYGREIKLIDVRALRKYTNKLFYGINGLAIPNVNFKYGTHEFITSPPKLI